MRIGRPTFRAGAVAGPAGDGGAGTRLVRLVPEKAPAGPADLATRAADPPRVAGGTTAPAAAEAAEHLFKQILEGAGAEAAEAPWNPPGPAPAAPSEGSVAVAIIGPPASRGP